MGCAFAADDTVDATHRMETSVENCYVTGAMVRAEEWQEIIVAGDGDTAVLDILSPEKGEDPRLRHAGGRSGARVGVSGHTPMRLYTDNQVTMAITDLHDLFVYKLRQQYYAEQQLVDTMDEMTRNATNDRLSQGFADHLEETQAHVERLEDVFAALDVPLETIEDPVVEGLEEVRHTLEREIDDDDMLDMVYLNAGMMTERVEMTTYEGLSLLATKLEFSDDVQGPLESNYDEEKSTYRELETLSTASEMKSLWDRLTPS